YFCENGEPRCPPGSSFDQGQGVCSTPSACHSSSDCAGDEWCDFPDDRCGMAEAGVCRARPTGCNSVYQPACSCSGVVVGNPCVGQLDGSDLDATGSCPPPLDSFACGPFFCAA